ncbi:MAG: S41 family peptidase, partial [Bacteroidota bacterium]
MERTLKAIFVGLLIIFVGVAAFAGGLTLGHLVPNAQARALGGPVSLGSTPSAQEQATTPKDLQTLFAPFWEAWNLVHEQYVNQPVDDVKLMQGAIRGMMEALGDKHSSYMDPTTYQQVNGELSGEYEGIG